MQDNEKDAVLRMSPTISPGESRDSATKDSPALDFEAIAKHERDALAIRWAHLEKHKPTLYKCDVASPPLVESHEAIGLALSGGGIRSATFALGVLQTLASKGVLGSFDYLSTVSGGGYIGSWLSAWIRRTSLGHVQSQLAKHQKSVPTSPHDTVSAEPPEVTWLRRYSNYLTPRLGLFSADSLTLVATWLRNVFLNLLVLLAFLVTLLLLPRLPLNLIESALGSPVLFGIVTAISGAIFILAMALNLWQQGQKSERPAWWQSQWAVLISVVLAGFLSLLSGVIWLFGSQVLTQHVAATAAVTSIAIIGLMGGAGWLCTEALTRDQLKGMFREALIYTLAFSVSLAVAAAILAAMHEQWRSIHALGYVVAVVTFGPPAFLVTFGVCGSLFVGLVGRLYYERSREWWSRMNAWFITLGLAWMVLFLLAFYIPAAVRWGADSISAWVTIPTLATWIGSLLTVLLAPRPGGTSKLVQQNIERALNIAASIFVAGFLIMVATGVTAAIARFAEADLAGAFDAMQPAPKVSSFDLTVKGEKGKIESNVKWKTESEPAFTTYFSADLEQLASIQGKAAWVPGSLPSLVLGSVTILLLFGWRVDVNKFSLHNMYKNRLIRCYLGASNATRSEQPFTGFDETDDAFRLSEFDAPPEWGGQKGPFHIVNTTINITQGSNLGWQERKAGSFVLTPISCGFAFGKTQGDSTRRTSSTITRKPGFRLTSSYASKDPEEPGFTLGMAMATSGAAVSPNMGRASLPALAFVLTIFNIRLGRWSPNPAGRDWTRSSPRIGLLCLLQELFGYSNEERSFVYLSDGGHFENMGLYELVRRQCAVIVAVDAGADADRSFADLGEAVRKCRIDFGVEIDLPLEALSGHGEFGLSREGFAVGTIRYNSGGANQKEGHLIVIKPSLRRERDEPDDVLAYASKNSTFPQQSTTDQWFDEGQFESYRRLGVFIASRCLAKCIHLIPARPIVSPLNPPENTNPPSTPPSALLSGATSYFRWLLVTLVGFVLFAVYDRIFSTGIGEGACFADAIHIWPNPDACANAVKSVLKDQSRAPAVVRLWFDNVFILIYTSMFALGYVTSIRASFQRSVSKWLRVTVWLLLNLVMAGALMDFAENAQLILALYHPAVPADVPDIAWASMWKFRLFVGNVVALSVFAAWAWHSRRTSGRIRSVRHYAAK